MRATQPMAEYNGHIKPNQTQLPLTESSFTPLIPESIKKGPGPLPTPIMDEQAEEQFWQHMEKMGIAKGTGDLGKFGDVLDGVVHRDPRVINLTSQTVKLMHKLLELPENALVALQDAGGNGAAYNSWLNLLSKKPDVPVVVLNFGAFGNFWTKDLRDEFSKKGFIGPVVEVKVKEGISPTIADIKDALKKAGYDDTTHFNLVATSHETGTGVELSENVLEWMANNKNIDIALLDVTSGLMTQKIPGLGSTISTFGALQKGLRAPASIGLAVIAEKHRPLLKEESQLPLPSFVSWSARNEQGQLIERSGIFDGTGVARSMAAVDILRLYYCLNHAISKAIEGKTAQDSLIEEAQKSREYMQDAVNEHVKSRKAEGKEPILDFMVEDFNARGAFNIVLKTGIDIPIEDLQKVKQRAYEILAKEGRLINISPFPLGETAKTNIYRVTTLGINSKEEARVVFDNLAYGFERARAEILGKSDITYVKAPANDEGIKIKGDKPARDIEKEVIKGIIVDPVGLLKDKSGQPDIKAAKEYAQKKGWIWHDGAIAEGEKLSAGIHVSYQPDIAPDEIKAQTDKGQYDFCIAAAKIVPAEAKLAEGGVRMGAGVNNMQSSSFGADAPLMNTPGQNSRATAERCIQAMLQSCMNLGQIAEEVAKGNVITPDILQYATRGLNGRKIAILGITGNIGQEVAKLAKAFGMEVVGWGRSLTPQMAADAGIVYAATPEAAVGEADFISVNISLSEKTTGFVGKKLFAAMKEDAAIVNFARAEIVDIAAAEKFLQENKGAKLITDADIFAENKGPLVPFIELAKQLPYQVTNYPHIAADCDHPSRVNAFRQAVDQIDKALSSRKVINNAGKLPEGYADGGKELPVGIGTLFSGASAKSITEAERVVRY